MDGHIRLGPPPLSDLWGKTSSGLTLIRLPCLSLERQKSLNPAVLHLSHRGKLAQPATFFNNSPLFLLAARRIRLQQSVWSYWLDIGWYTVLTALSGGTSSIFFFGFLFAILAVSFERGFRLGMLATIVSATLFILVTLETAREGLELEMHRFLVRLLYLLVLGYLMAR